MRLQRTSYWPDTNLLQGHADLNLQGSEPNVTRDMSSQYGDHFFELVLTWDFK